MDLLLSLTEYDEVIMVLGVVLMIFGFFITGALIAGFGLLIYLVELEKVSF